ncbi:hypothetical protein ABC345_02910 [Shouchella sp. 1P09AA]|uniref:hypothetical protein n=1 Tax=unclassified Shouchella TaxID=2893065 RepID=UPI0039A051C1
MKKVAGIIATLAVATAFVVAPYDKVGSFSDQADKVGSFSTSNDKIGSFENQSIH